MVGLGKRFWDPDNEINSSLFQALEAALFKPKTVVPAGTTADDATLITTRVSLIESGDENAGLILPNEEGLFIIITDLASLTRTNIYPSPGTKFNGATYDAGLPQLVGGNSPPYGLLIVRASPTVWGVVGTGN